MIQWSVVSVVVTALFWAVWYLIEGSVPVVTSVKITSDWTLQLPFVISRLTDIIFTPILACLIILGIDKVSKMKEAGLITDIVEVGIGVGIYVGICAGIIACIGLCFGVDIIGAGIAGGILVSISMGILTSIVEDIGTGIATGMSLSIVIVGLVIAIYAGMGISLVTVGIVVAIYAGIVWLLKTIFPWTFGKNVAIG